MTTNLFNLRSTWLRKGASALTDQGLVAAAGFSTTILLGRWLPPAEYGAYALAFSVFLFLAGFHNALLLEPMSVLGPASYRNCLPAYLRSVLQLHFALTFLLAVSLSLLGACLKFWMPHSSVSAALLGVSIGTPWILLLWLGRRAAYLELKPTSALRGAATYAIALVALLFLFQRRQWLSPLTVFLLQAPAACLASAVIFASVVPRLKSRQTGVAIGTVLKQHWDYGRWVVATAFVYWITAGANYVMVGALLRMEDVGAFRSLQNFALPVPQFVTAMSLLLLPHASASFSQRGSIALRQNTKKFVFLFATGGLLYMVGLLFFGGWLFKHLYAGRYVEFVYLLPLVALPIPLMAVAEVIAMALRAMRAPQDVLLAYTVSGVLTLLVGVALTYFWGLGGVLVGMLISSLGFLIAVVHRYRTRLRDVALPATALHAEASRQDVRVAWLMPSLDRGYYWQPIFREFTRVFPNTVIFTGLWPGFLPGFEETFSVRRLDGVRFVELKRRTNGYASGFVWAPFSILPELLRFRPHVIFTTGFNLWTLQGLCVKLLTGSRIVLLWDGISPAIAYLDAPLRLSVRRIMARFLDECISNTYAGVDYLRKVLAVPASRLRQHAYEVPSIEFLGSRNDCPDILKSCSRPTFLYVGQLIERKGVETLLRACGLLKRQGLADFSTLIVGDGDLGRELRELAAKLGLGDQVHWAGRVGYQELGTFYRACDIFVFPTHEDIWGMVALEAMAFGKPILCSKHAGSRELIFHDKNGFVFDPGDPQELAQYMARLIGEPGLIERLGAISKQITERYTPESAACLLAATVSTLLGAGGNATRNSYEDS